MCDSSCNDYLFRPAGCFCRNTHITHSTRNLIVHITSMFDHHSPCLPCPPFSASVRSQEWPLTHAGDTCYSTHTHTHTHTHTRILTHTHIYCTPSRPPHAHTHSRMHTHAAHKHTPTLLLRFNFFSVFFFMCVCV